MANDFIYLYLNVTWMEWAWFVANLVAGVCFIHITYELFQWCRGLGINGTVGLVAIVLSFIVTCGPHHLAMLRFLGHHPVDALQLTFDLATMATALTASVALSANRRQIKTVIAFVSAAWKKRKPQ